MACAQIWLSSSSVFFLLAARKIIGTINFELTGTFSTQQCWWPKAEHRQSWVFDTASRFGEHRCMVLTVRLVGQVIGRWTLLVLDLFIVEHQVLRCLLFFNSLRPSVFEAVRMRVSKSKSFSGKRKMFVNALRRCLLFEAMLAIGR